jgi:hypothetical protein
MNREFSQPESEPVLERIEHEYLNSSLPSKIKKTELLRELGLPIPKTDFFPRGEIAALRKRLVDRLADEKRPMIVRVACVPDKFTMPAFLVDAKENIDQAMKKIEKLVEQDRTITHFILQFATPKDKIIDKIVGRIVYGSASSLPSTKTVELFKGAKNAEIFNHLDTRNRSYERLEQKLGEFVKPKVKSKTISEEEVKNIHTALEGYEPQLEIAKKIFAKGQNKTNDEISTTFEFSYRDGNLVFVDID